MRSHWILLQGLSREARHWGQFPEKLKAELLKRGEHANVDAIDMPGAGRYSEMAAPLTVEEMTDFVREKYIELRRRQRVSGETPSERTRLFAISMGGMIATDWVTRWPGDFKKLMIANTSYGRFSRAYQRLTPFALKHMLSNFKTMSHVERELHGLQLISNLTDQKAHLTTAEQWAKFAEERPMTFENFSRQMLASARFRAPIEKPAIPTLVLYSAKDRMVSSECSKEIIRRWQVSSAVHSTAGHDIVSDAPDWVIEQILEWDASLKDFPDRSESLRQNP